MNQDQLLQRANQVFNAHPKEDTVFITSDGKAFFDREAAGNRLPYIKGEDRQIHTFKRKNVVSDIVLLKKKQKEEENKAAEERIKKEAEARKKQAEEEAAKQAEIEAQNNAKAEAKEGHQEESTEAVPDESWTRDEIKHWLTDRGIKFASNSKEETLLKKVKEYLEAGE